MRQTRGDAMVSATLHMVDLAGSERIKKSKAEGARRREAVGINESLMVLGKVISALVEGKSHVPYLECKLTTLLKGALGGASRTTAVVCCRQDDNQAEETLQALRFGERCALVSNVQQTVAASSASEALKAIDATLKQCEASLEGLRKRIQSLFLHFMETPEFNPESARLEKVPRDFNARPYVKPILNDFLQTK